MTLVDEHAFSNIPTLTKVQFGSGENIRLMSNAFYHTGLETLRIPANVTYIGEYCFVGLEKLTAFEVDAGNPNYTAVDGLLMSKDQRKLIAVPAGRAGSLTVPKTVEVIGFGAFEQSKLTQVQFPEDANILTIGYRAFFGSAIREITVPASVVSIDYYAFAYCEALESVTFAGGDQLKGIYEGAFLGCIHLEQIELPDSIVEISDFAFYGCSKLDRVPVSSTAVVLGIYDYAFAYTGINGDFTTQYSFKASTTSFTIPESLASKLGYVEVGVTLSNLFSRREQLLEAHHVAVYRDLKHEIFLCYGGSPGYCIYQSQRTTPEMEAGSNAFYGNTDTLYIPYENTFTVGSYQHPIRALCQCNEQILVMSDEALWGLSPTREDTDEMALQLLRSGMGCTSDEGALLFDDTPVSIWHSGILGWSIKENDQTSCSATLLSADISDHMTPSLVRNAILFRNKRKNELWVRDITDSDGTVWIYSFPQKRWFTFDSIHANCFFELNGAVAFADKNGGVCVFDDALSADDGKSIHARYQSHYLCFSRPEIMKRAIRAALCANDEGNSIQLTLETERTKKTFSIVGRKTTAPAYFDRRLAIGRFRFLRYSFSASGVARSRIHFLHISANN